MYWVNCYHFHHMYGQLFLLNFWLDDISSFILFSSIISSLVLILDYVSVYFCKVPSVLNELSIWTLIQGRFENPITVSLFDAFKLFHLILLTCNLTVLHLFFLEMYRIFLPWFLLGDINSITIYSTSVKWCFITNIIKLEIENMFNVMSIDRPLILW